MNVLTFKDAKKNGDKLALITCYDSTSAKIASKTQVDAILVGDSVAMTMLGENNTLTATTEQLCLFTKAVAKNLGSKLLITDMPFLSNRMGQEQAVRTAGALMAAGAHAVKIEGFLGNLEIIQHLVNSGIPVMGHLGLTPQFVHALGGYRVQGRDSSTADAILHGAHELEKAGCFGLVLECVPSSLARTITNAINIPTIGIGAGPDTDGQILVWQDLLGMNTDFQPKFVRRYVDGSQIIHDALQSYVKDVKETKFPMATESYE